MLAVNMWRHTRTALVAAALAAVACDHTRAAAGVETRRVLFVGNSLTTTNDLPAMVESLSVGGGGPRLECHAVAFPGYSLEDHWNRGDAARAIGAGGWAAVVLQQGPSALPESRAGLVEYARRFDVVVKRAGARTALYMVWPASSRSVAPMKAASSCEIEYGSEWWW